MNSFFLNWLTFSFLVYPVTAHAFEMLTSGGNSEIDSLKSITRGSQYFPSAQHRLAQIYILQNTVTSRKAAEEACRRAVETDPSKVEFRLTLCGILYQRGFYIALNKACDDILKNSPPGRHYAEAHYYKGLIRERSALKYKNMIAPVGNGNSVSLSEYGISDLREAARAYEAALTYAPDHRDALFHLGSVYLEVQAYEPMLALFLHILTNNPRDKDALVFAALAQYHLFRPDISDSLYEKALILMSRDEATQFKSISYVIPSPDVGRKGYSADTDDFWQGKDPLLLTPVNERRLEHYNRVAYCNLRFGVPSMKIDGWNTERGMIYIRYGTPLYVTRIQPDERFLGGREVWTYEDKEFLFEDYYASGHFQMDNNSLLAAESAFHDSPDAFAFPPETVCDFSARIYQFKGAEGSTKVSAFLSANFPKNVHTLETTADLGLFLLNDRDSIRAEGRASSQIQITSQLDLPFRGEMTVDHVKGNMGIKKFSAELQTRKEHYTGISRDSIRLRDFSGTKLMMSDVILSDEDVGVPNATNQFRSDRPIRTYFEIYNLTDPGSQTHFRIEAGLRKSKSTGFLGALTNLLNSNDLNVVSSTSEVNGSTPDEKYKIQMDISDSAPGSFNFLIKVTDLNSGQSVDAAIPITIVR